MPEHQEKAPSVNNEQHPAVVEDLVVPLHAEEITVSRQIIERDVVRVATVTHSREQLVDEQLAREDVEVTRVPVGRIVEAMPSVREEGDLTIMPVVEEIVVIERRLLLKEEVHIRRIRSTEQHRETITIRGQEALVTRVPAAGHDPHDPAAARIPVSDSTSKEPHQ